MEYIKLMEGLGFTYFMNPKTGRPLFYRAYLMGMNEEAMYVEFCEDNIEFSNTKLLHNDNDISIGLDVEEIEVVLESYKLYKEKRT